MLLKIFNSKFLRTGILSRRFGIIVWNERARGKAEMGVQPAIDSLSWQEIFIDEYELPDNSKVKRSRSLVVDWKGRSPLSTRPNGKQHPQKQVLGCFYSVLNPAFLTYSALTATLNPLVPFVC